MSAEEPKSLVERVLDLLRFSEKPMNALEIGQKLDAIVDGTLLYLEQKKLIVWSEEKKGWSLRK